MTTTENKKVFIYILVAFVFSIAVRLIWVYQFNGVEQFIWNNQFMINTNDGYWYAEGARDILSGDMNKADMSAYKTVMSLLTAYIVKFLPVSFETVILYMSIFFGSLLVMPIILICKRIGHLEVGFIAALLASIAWSYYNRTMIGYYDTDMLNIVFPTIFLWSLIWAIDTKEDKYLIITVLDIILYRIWYPQSYSLEFAFAGMVILYTIYQYIKKENLNYTLILLSFMLFSMMGLDVYIRLCIVIALFLLLKLRRSIFIQYRYYFLTLALIAFFVTGGIEPIMGYIDMYIIRDVSMVNDSSDLSLHFFSVLQTVREAGHISFETFANRISGHTSILILAVIGYIWLTFKHNIMLFAIPMVGLGFLALSGGLRFTVYAVPIMAIGIAFLIYKVSQFLSSLFADDKIKKVINYVFLSIFTLAVLYPNIKHVQNYKVPTVFTKDEVAVLDKLKKIADREDYVVGWWDYGYPIRYYSDTRTLIDGNKHSGATNFPVSFILTHPQNEASKMLRLDVEYTEDSFKIADLNKDKNKSEQIKRINNIGQMTLDYGFKDTNKFLDSLKSDIKLPKKTRDIYLYLPSRMMNIYPTVTLFSNLDLMTGVKGRPPFFYKTNRFKEDAQSIDLGQGIVLDKKTSSIILGRQKIPIKRFTKTFYDKSKKLQRKEMILNKSSNLNIIYMSDYKQFLVVEDSVYNSLYFQLFVFENYDKNLFEPTFLTPLVKVYKLKI